MCVLPQGGRGGGADLLVGLAALLLLLDSSHELLRLLVLRGHDVGHAQVGQHDGGHLVRLRVRVRVRGQWEGLGLGLG